VLFLCSFTLAGFGGCSHSPQGLLLLPNCRCRRAVAVVVPSLSFCRRCCRATVDVVSVLLLCSFALADFGDCSHSPKGMLLLPNCRCRRAVAIVRLSLSSCRRCRSAVTVVARPSMSFVCSCCALWLLLALMGAVTLLKGSC
jgi:hypothetical protein